ncbi:DNA methyltransferase [Paraburkholderia sediminicola]|uniref:DNA methyltransferase n=1 Tax=Paraburkholderia sediminicola TaxID=458836 RepID=UPI0038B70337
MAPKLRILSPKRNKRLQTGWEGFFPYYAGFPELFARELLQSAKLQSGAVILDPWNGSGTTTYAASSLGLTSVGIDLNPAMIIVARARLLPPSEADHLQPLAATIVSHAHSALPTLHPNDALLCWFKPSAASFIRGIEQNIRRSLVGSMTKSPEGVHLDRISGTAATLYVALFAVCRKLVAPFRSSNPTWLRIPKQTEARIAVSRQTVARCFEENVRDMSAALASKFDADTPRAGECEINLSDTVSMKLDPGSVDFVLTSPPYCTRIDYTAATRIELAVLGPLLSTDARALGKQMIGSTQVPGISIDIDEKWGKTCARFLETLQKHPSKASGGYYYRTHLDYFDKMSRSIGRMSEALKPGSRAVLVVQDSYYKDVHNDLPKIISEIAGRHGLSLKRREDFHLRSMSDINPGRQSYKRPSGATESVLCFAK